MWILYHSNYPHKALAVGKSTEVLRQKVEILVKELGAELGQTMVSEYEDVVTFPCLYTNSEGSKVYVYDYILEKLPLYEKLEEIGSSDGKDINPES